MHVILQNIIINKFTETVKFTNLIETWKKYQVINLKRIYIFFVG